MESKTTEVIDKSLFWWSSQNWNSCIRRQNINTMWEVWL